MTFQGHFNFRFDETFDMVLPEGTDVSKTYVLLSVKDQSPVLGEGLLLGEALLPLADIVKEDGDVSLKVRHLKTLSYFKLLKMHLAFCRMWHKFN